MDISAASTDNETIVRRLMDAVWGQGHLHLIPDFVADDYVGHFPIGDHYGPEGYRLDVATYRSAFPDLSITIDDLFAVADKVVRRFTLHGTHCRPFLSTPANGQPVVLRAIAIDRIANGQLRETWIQADNLSPPPCENHDLEPPKLPP
jgi:steroid delta-isomerase-like uncharacterized protein